MKKNISYALIAALVSIIAVTINAVIFNSKFAKASIDIWAFSIAIFLIIEAFYKILSTRDPFWPSQFLRFIRIIIGSCIFTIHTCQIIYGI